MAYVDLGMIQFATLRSAIFVIALSLAVPLALAAAPVIEAVSFAIEPGRLYVPAEQVGKRLRWRLNRSQEGLSALNGIAVNLGDTRVLNGSVWLPVDRLPLFGATVTPDVLTGQFTVTSGRRSFLAVSGSKKVEIDLSRQRLYAWQGGLLVLETKISSGRNGATPPGNYTAGPYKSRMHYSSRYHNAPMPWSVQVNGHIFIHGFSSVPDYPASHGCIRVPLSDFNPARLFYEWVDTGTPVRIARSLVEAPAVVEEIRRAQPAG
jgi:hypothetical protein